MDNDNRSFGERHAGITYPVLGLQAAPRELRRASWNYLHMLLFPASRDGVSARTPLCHPPTLLRKLGIYKRWVIDELPNEPYRAGAVLKEWLLTESSWHEFYEFLECLPRFAGLSGERAESLRKSLNNVLEDERSPYRFVDSRLAPITSPEEVEEVTSATGHSGQFTPASEHIRTALDLLSQKPTPDYENSAKEAVSAVESALCVPTGVKPGNIDRATGKFNEKYGTHPGLLVSASKLYEFGSNADGVRHASTGKAKAVGEAEAHLVLVQASTWVNYLVRIATKT